MNKELEANTTLSHYRIVSKIGAGGMGEVFLAEDTRLDRKIALKILPETFAQDDERMRRFVREAKSASALNHPNIITIHEIGAEGNTHFIATEYIEGETLRERLRREPLGFKAALDVAVQIASALQAAHGAGIVHRDIKPDNVMIRPDGLAKLLDFGIAKLTEKKPELIDAEAATAIKARTKTGMLIGTAAYMSPEQARGKAVDARSDIFSFGLVLYEMLTGRAAFEGANAMDVIASILHKEPVPLSQHVPDVPREIERIVGKALRKDCEERYQTTKDLLIDLKDAWAEQEFQNKLERAAAPRREKDQTQIINATTTEAAHTTSSAEYIAGKIKNHKRAFLAAALAVLLVAALGFGWWFYANRSASNDGKSINAIAVLPLKPIGAANRDEFYEVGIADSLIYKLSSIKGFVVRPLSATRKYADVGQDPIAAGREQQVDYVLASNYQLAGGKIRVTAQLFDVASGEIKETYKTEKDAGNIFALQDAIAVEVGNILLARFATTSNSPAAKRGTNSEEAYRLYLQGKNLTARRSPADARKAIEYFEQAIRLDPNFAAAYSGMASAYLALGLLGADSPREEFEKALETVKKALELNNELSEAHAVFGQLKARYEWDFAGAEKELLRAIELEPNSDRAHNGYANYLTTVGRFDEAIAQIKIALDIDPNSLVNQRDYGRFLYYARRYDEAIVQLKRVVEVDAGFLTTYSWLWQAYHLKGDYAHAYEWFLKHHQQRKASPERIELYKNVYETLGWLAVLQKQVEIHKSDEKGEGDHPPDSRIVLLSALLGDKDQAFEYLNKSFEKRHGQMTSLKAEPCLDSLRGDPRFAELVRRVGLPQ
jgi:eukaryotic-like serine/threonine-protein kinase